MTTYVLSVLTFGSIYALLALGLNLMWGMTGMVNLGILGYYAIGGYVLGPADGEVSRPAGLRRHADRHARRRAARCRDLYRPRQAARRLPCHRHARLAQVMALIAPERDLADQRHRWHRPGPPARRRAPGQERQPYSTCWSASLIVALVFVGTEVLRRSPFPDASCAPSRHDDWMVAATAGKYVFGYQMKALAVGGGIMGLAGALLCPLYRLHLARGLPAAAADLHLPRADPPRRSRQPISEPWPVPSSSSSSSRARASSPRSCRRSRPCRSVRSASSSSASASSSSRRTGRAA